MVHGFVLCCRWCWGVVADWLEHWTCYGESMGGAGSLLLLLLSAYCVHNAQFLFSIVHRLLYGPVCGLILEGGPFSGIWALYMCVSVCVY